MPPNIIQSYATRDRWFTNYLPAGSYEELPAGACPLFPQDVVMRFTLRDGVRPQYDVDAARNGSPERERIQLQAASILSNGRTFCLAGAIRFAQIPRNDLPWCSTLQNHDHGLPQANWLLEVIGGQLALNVPDPAAQRAGRFSRRHYGHVPIELGRWMGVAIHWRPSEGTDGFYDYYVDGQLRWSMRGTTAAQADPGYLIMGVYRAAAINGTAVVDYAGWRLHDGLVVPGGQTQEPPAADVDGPTLEITTPDAGAVVDRRQPVEVRVAASDPSGILRVVVEAAGVQVWAETATPYGDGTYSWPASVPSGPVTLKATAIDRAGNQTSVEQPIVLGPATDPPPPPPDHMAEIREALASASASIRAATAAVDSAAQMARG